MTGSRNEPLVVRVRRRGWRARLEIQPGTGHWTKSSRFTVAPLGQAKGQRMSVTAQVCFTEARALDVSAPARWFVKIYRCSTQGQAEALRTHLAEQARKLDHNHLLGGAGRTPVQAPFAVVPVFVCRGDGTLDDQTTGGETVLGAPEPAEPERVSLPGWLGASADQPELYVFALSPWADRPSWGPGTDLGGPNVDQLDDFVTMARGLDQLHSSGWAHCDIKPANVRQFGFAGFALVDTDSAVCLGTPPELLRITRPYSYGPLCDRTGAGDRGPVAPAVLMAQDRFGFALCVLYALAGPSRADELLSTEDLDPDELRAIDTPGVLESWLTSWWGPRWSELIKVLVRPFAPGDGSVEGFESTERAWLSEWIEALQAVRRPNAGRTAAVTTAGERAETLVEIRRRALVSTVAHQERAVAGWRALELIATDLAVTAARRRLLGSALAVVCTVAVVLFGALVQGK